MSRLQKEEKQRAIGRFAAKLALAYIEAKKPDVEARLYVDTCSEVAIAYEQLLVIINVLNEADVEKTLRAPRDVFSKIIELKNGSAIKISIKPELVSRTKASR